MDLRFSRVAPSVEDNLLALNTLVKQTGARRATMTESQNRRMVAYLGNIEDMRQQLVIMIQRYEDDDSVISRLLELVDRIDEVKGLATVASGEEEGPDGADLVDDAEIAKQYDTPFNPLVVSAVNVLGISGLLSTFHHDHEGDQPIEEEDDEHEEDEEDETTSKWDCSDDEINLPPDGEGEQTTIDNTTPLQINLSLSHIGLPIPEGVTLPPPQPLYASNGYQPENVPLQPVQHQSYRSASVPHISVHRPPDAKEKEKGKGKEREEVARDIKVSSKRERKRPKSYIEPYISSSGSEESPRVPVRTRISRSRSRSRSLSQSRSSSCESISPRNNIPVPPPLPPFNRRGNPSSSSAASSSKGRLVGTCPPTLCKICYEEYSSWNHLYQIGCTHIYCKECLVSYLTTNIQEGAVLDLVCPCPGCDTEFDANDIRFLCDSTIIAKYERFIVIASLRADPNTRWCPNPKCSNGIKADPKQPWVSCNLCNFEFCFTCLAGRHDGANCGKEALELLEKRRQADATALQEFSAWAEAHKTAVKPCPQCNTFIEKTEGCNHMTCGNQACRYQFCWLCLGDYANGTHFNDAVNYPNCYEKQFWYPPDAYVEPPFAAHGRRRAIRRIAKKIGIYVGVGVAVATLGVPAAVIGGPVYGCFMLHKRLKAKRRREALMRSHHFHHNPDFIPPTAARIEEARREVERLRALEREL